MVLLGEAPGAREDASGRPFVGASGRVLDRLLASIGLARGDVFITNVLKARPPGNRDPTAAEIAHSLPWLDLQLSIIRPRFVVLLGRHAMRVFVNDLPISAARGRAVTASGRTYFPVFHPAAGIRSKARMVALEEDFACLGGLLEAAGGAAGRAMVAAPRAVSSR